MKFCVRYSLLQPLNEVVAFRWCECNLDISLMFQREGKSYKAIDGAHNRKGLLIAVFVSDL